MNYTPRLLEAQCRQALADRKVLVLLGARQTGKTTLVRHLVDGVDERRRLFLNMDDAFLRDRLCTTEGLLLRTIEEQAGVPLHAISSQFFLVVDEAQKAPRLFEQIKALVDAHRERLAVVLTGSSVLELHDPVAESLAGRARILHLHPFTLHEAFTHTYPSLGTPESPAPLLASLLSGRFDEQTFRALEERCRWHSREKRAFVRSVLTHPLFPEPASQVGPEAWIRDYLSTYFEKDIQALSAVGNVALFRACLRQLAAHCGNPLKWETAAQQVGTTSVTLRKYAGLMQQTLNLIALSAFAVNPVVRVTRAPKLYLADQGLLWGLRGYEDLPLLEATGMLGIYMESAVVAELAKWAALESTSPELRFWSKTSVSEVDVVLSNRGFHIPIEIKLSDQFERSWLRGLDAFDADHQRLGLVIPYRIVVYQGEPARLDARTFALPWWAFI